MSDLAYRVEVQPASPPPPPVLRLRRNSDNYPEVVMREDKAFEVYLALKDYFEGGLHDAEAQRDGCRVDQAVRG